MIWRNTFSERNPVKATTVVLPALAALLLCTVCTAAEDTWLSGVDTWGGRAASPAVVDPAVRSPLQDVISLRGSWDFAVDAEGIGRVAGWVNPGAAWPGLRSIQVPGCWEAQGVGQPGMSTTWDCKWDCALRALRHAYLGSAWYRRTISLPIAWQGKRIWLKLGGVQAQGWFWVNGQPVAHLDSYCGTYKYDITDLVVPGKEAVVVALVRNDVSSRKGAVNAGHRWGGLYRDVEIEATPSTWIDDCWVDGDFDHRAAIVHVAIGAVAADKVTPRFVDIKVRTTEGEPAGQITQEVIPRERRSVDLACIVPLSVFQPWSPARPRLYLADVTLRDCDRKLHGWQQRFGVRKLEVRGNRFYLNNQPFFVRAYGDDFVYPVELASPASRELHKEHFEVARRSGFVYARLHTHCEWPEFFEAADEAGISSSLNCHITIIGRRERSRLIRYAT